MLYQDLRFPVAKNRPFFYTNFVSTVDGKVQVTKDPYAYWPIGSKLDYKTLIELRACADVLIHGKNTAFWMRHIDNLFKNEFKNLRKKIGKEKDLAYMVLSNHPDKKLAEHIRDENSYLITSKSGAKKLGYSSGDHNVLAIGENGVDLKKFSSYLFKNGYKRILVEGGPKLLGQFLAEDLLDEIFLTIAPKIFGNEDNATLTMVEGHLFPANKVKNLQLLSVKKIKDELYLRYKISR